MDTKRSTTLTKRFQEIYGRKPKFLITAPGRINLIGEHTDYSDGFVLPVAIHLNVLIAMGPIASHTVQIFSVDFEESMAIDLGNLIKGPNNWGEYVKAIAWAMDITGYPLKGWQGVIAGNIPIGAGLSSSAAFQVAITKAFSLVGDVDVEPTKIAQIARKSEIDWVGVKVGIMDQLVSAAGKKDHAVLLDCRSLDFEYVPIPDQASYFVLDTMTRRELTQSAYNQRHEEVAEAARLLGVQTLRDATMEMLDNPSISTSPTLHKRTKHVLTENERVQKFRAAMQEGDLNQMGQLLNASHKSLRDNFEVSSKSLNLFVDLATQQPGCYGARMTGAGFGGCALALVDSKNDRDFITAVSEAYHLKTGIHPHVFKTMSADGVNAIELVHKKED